MHTYEYRCDVCGHLFEKYQSMKDKPVAKFPKCGGKVQRLISSGFGVILKGSGTYATGRRGSTSLACGQERPCCGRETPCDERPCES